MNRVVNKLLQNAHHLIEMAIVFFSPALAQIGIVVLAVLVDTATGVWAAKKSGEKIVSSRLGDIVPKLCVYILLILLAHGVEVIFVVAYARTLVAVGLMAIELMSIDENFKRATGNGLLKPLIGLLKRR